MIESAPELSGTQQRPAQELQCAQLTGGRNIVLSFIEPTLNHVLDDPLLNL